LLTPAAVVSRLTAVARGKTKSPHLEEQFKDSDGKIFLRAKREGRGGVTFTVHGAATADRKAVAEAIDAYLQRLAGNR
jgi:hypothetical protein